MQEPNIIFEATIPKNSWLGIGFGKNDTFSMVKVDYIQFVATDKPETSEAKDLYSESEGLPVASKENIITNSPSTLNGDSIVIKTARLLDSGKGDHFVFKKNENYKFIYALNEKDPSGTT